MTATNGHPGNNGGEGGVRLDLSNGHDRQMMRRWGLKAEDRKRYRDALMKALETAAGDARQVASIVKTAVAMEAQDQADEHFIARMAAERDPDRPLEIRVVYEQRQLEGVDDEDV